MSEIKLLPCPFCGGEAYLYEDKKCDIYSVGCKNCCDIEPITRVCESKEEAIKLWNTRKPMQEIVERLEEYRDDFMENVYRELESDSDNNRANRIIYGFDEATEMVKEVGGMNEL